VVAVLAALPKIALYPALILIELSLLRRQFPVSRSLEISAGHTTCLTPSVRKTDLFADDAGALPLPARKIGGALETSQSSCEKTLVVASYVRQLVAHAVTLQTLGKSGLATLGGTGSLQAFSNSLKSHVTACE